MEQAWPLYYYHPPCPPFLAPLQHGAGRLRRCEAGALGQLSWCRRGRGYFAAPRHAGARFRRGSHGRLAGKARLCWRVQLIWLQSWFHTAGHTQQVTRSSWQAAACGIDDANNPPTLNTLCMHAGLTYKAGNARIAIWPIAPHAFGSAQGRALGRPQMPAAMASPPGWHTTAVPFVQSGQLCQGPLHAAPHWQRRCISWPPPCLLSCPPYRPARGTCLYVCARTRTAWATHTQSRPSWLVDDQICRKAGVALMPLSRMQLCTVPAFLAACDKHVMMRSDAVCSRLLVWNATAWPRTHVGPRCMAA